jgi:hypothetical protein
VTGTQPPPPPSPPNLYVAGDVDDTWVHEIDGTVYELAASEHGWLVTITVTGTGTRGRPRCFGDRMLAEQVYFRTVAAAIIAHRPHACAVTIGDALLVLTRAGARWHLAERSPGAPIAAAFTDERSARQAWLDRGDELLRKAVAAPPRHLATRHEHASTFR